MEAVILDIIATLKAGNNLTEKTLAQIILRHNQGLGSSRLRYPKKQLLPYYLGIKSDDPQRWHSWDISPDIEARLLQVLKVKPRRTASGVATVSVITKPWPCTGDCLYCPSDVRMPKSYLSDEPACQRAERSYFDPYLQAVSRLKALSEMGHATDKVELIILGGTWSDYPVSYQVWFVSELFRALNDGEAAGQAALTRQAQYVDKGLTTDPGSLAELAQPLQKAVDSGALAYNQAWQQLYGPGSVWQAIAQWQQADFDELERLQAANEGARQRVVGLSVETRPDLVDVSSLTLLRRLGCTKVQMGVQSLDDSVLLANQRQASPARVGQAFQLLRLFGFKTHVHFMLNLLGATPEGDRLDYRQLVSDPDYLPDEVKLYPCVLTANSRLMRSYTAGCWQPYDESELISLLAADVLATPPYTRISRMVRDISAQDIVAGSRKANLRQYVEAYLASGDEPVQEIRHREVATGQVEVATLKLEVVAYTTTATDERFLQWTDAAGRIAGFLRLSLPKPGLEGIGQPGLPVGPQEAMIRELHVYGPAARINVERQTEQLEASSPASPQPAMPSSAVEHQGPQHQGLGRRLVQAACQIAREAGYTRLNVISSVGTREYYRRLGFTDNGLYQQKVLD